jgi:hypothetical protein
MCQMARFRQREPGGKGGGNREVAAMKLEFVADVE